MKCECGYEFAGPGEFRREQAFVTKEGDSGIICPTCGTWYVHTGGRWCRVNQMIQEGKQIGGEDGT